MLSMTIQEENILKTTVKEHWYTEKLINIVENSINILNTFIIFVPFQLYFYTLYSKNIYET